MARDQDAIVFNQTSILGTVIPADAGIHAGIATPLKWIPAFAGIASLSGQHWVRARQLLTSGGRIEPGTMRPSY